MWKLDQILLQATETFLRSLRQRLLIMILVAVLPILALILYQAKVLRSLQIAEVQENAWQTVENVVLRGSRFTDSARQLLSLLADAPEVRRGDKTQCDELLTRFAQQNPFYVELGVAGSDGLVWCRALPSNMDENLSRASHFQRALAVKGFAIGDYRRRGASDRETLSFALPVLERDGNVRAVVFAAFDILWIHQLAAERHMPEGAALSIVDSRGILLARFPQTEKWAGKHIPDAPMFEMLRLRSQLSRELTGLDGVDRIYALKPLTPNPTAGQIYIMVGIPKTLAYDPVNAALTRNLAWLGIVSVAACLLAWFVGSKCVVGYVKVRVQAEEERAKLAAIVESSEDAIIGMTLEGQITSWNDGAESTYGFTKEEMIGRCIVELIPPNQHNEIFELMQVIKQGRGINRYESKRRRKDGQLFDISASLSPVRDVQRNVIGAATITRDITLLRKGEEQLLAYTDQLESLNLVAQEIAETLSMEQVIERALNRLILVSGFDFAAVHFSEEVRGRKFYGLSAKPCSLSEIEQIWTDLGSEFERCFWQRTESWFVSDVKATPEFALTVEKNEIKSLAVLPLRQKAPRAAITMMSLRVHRFAAEEKHFLSAMSRQIGLAVENARLYSATVQANQELRWENEDRKRAEQALADFTAMVAHDLRSPLANVISITDSIRDEVFGPVTELQERWLAKMQESCKGLISHVSDFLDISKIDAGELQLVKSPADLKSILEDGLFEHSVEAERKRIVLRTEISHDLPRMFVDVRRLSQVLENLLNNALKFTEPGGEILLAARRCGDAEVVWSVKDSGIGVPYEEFDRIFEKYRQVAPGQHSSRSGTGLGLAICKKIVQAHGGRIWVESEREKGSTFFVSLPAFDPPDERRLLTPA
jgi:PAS domain S-box-containing protein